MEHFTLDTILAAMLDKVREHDPAKVAIASDKDCDAFKVEQCLTLWDSLSGAVYDKPKVPLHALAPINVTPCQSILPGDMPALTAIPEGWRKALLKRKASRRPQSNRKALDIVRLPDGVAEGGLDAGKVAEGAAFTGDEFADMVENSPHGWQVTSGV